MLAPLVQTGLDLLSLDEFAPLRGQRVGLVANPAAIDGRLRHAADLLINTPQIRLTALFGPEHGFGGDVQDLTGVADAMHPRYRCPVFSLYGDSVESLRPTESSLRGLDVLVIDLPDIGSRYYTFQATMLFCLEAAAASDLPVIVLDRPNPLNGVTIEGPAIEPGMESFVGPHSIPTRHGMTLGELALMYVAERNIPATLRVIPFVGWRRDHYFDETFLPWVMPSPNMPTLDTALVYPGQCLLEGTNVSEGRGTTRPFELCGAPWAIAERVAARLPEDVIPGAIARPVTFRPTFHKYAGQSCNGVQLHVTDRSAFRPVRTSLAILTAFRAEGSAHFRWRNDAYEFVDNVPAIDLLFGGSRERLALQSGLSVAEIARPWSEHEAAFKARREPFLLY
ncbi:MAG TPA: DUF1343 domain-containing protein [Gemmataceae bacterium]|jgi:uncharacterized protein YbbC (DUF1343 family)|nr:DUF1343 domain-containing protein [Gemmataceae bacterium]